ncbi:transcription-repair coupling factor [Marinospirillum alkalitolerans]
MNQAQQQTLAAAPVPLLHHPLPQRADFQQRWLGVKGSAESLALVEAAQRHSGLSVLVCASSQQAQALASELAFFAPSDLPILQLPDWEVLPYDRFSPHQDIISARLSTLLHLHQQQQGLLILPVTTLMQRLAPTDFVASQVIDLQVGQRLDLHQFRQQLEQAGYRAVNTVYEHGEFAVRGGLMDLFPMGCEQPLRLELFDDELESLRFFDQETQRSLEKTERLSLLPAQEFPLTPEALALFRTEFQTRFDVDLSRCQIYQDTLQGRVSPGLEFLLPLFFTHTAHLGDYLPDQCLWIEMGEVQTAAEHYWQEIQRRYESLRHDIEHPCLPPESLYLTPEQIQQLRKLYPQVRLTPEPVTDSRSGDVDLRTADCPEVGVQAKAQDPLQALRTFQQQHPDTAILICAESPGRKEALRELFNKHQLATSDSTNWLDFITHRPALSLCIAPLDRGCWLAEHKLLLVTEAQLFGERIQQRRQRQKSQINQDLVFKSLSELVIGSPVVHQDHGIGRYQGLITLEAGGQPQEFLQLIYADEAKLYVPVSALDRISRYSGTTDERAPLHRLGSDQWDKTKRKALEKIRDTAAELLDIYARREAQQGHAFELDDSAWDQFCASFPFEETVDQELAIQAVLRDMARTRPMDRVICGDVGFGKTEVAMRAAFVAVHGGKQVAVLVPTTLLAQQHYENFRDRFADWPVKVELLSRFRSAKQQQQAIEQLEAGQVDILIGTHKLLQSSIQFKDLGLVIIDEEHRFGVRQKEQLKSLRAQVDLLSLTATPIPRTLNMAMSGIRDLSIIATPPARRLSVKTFVRKKEEALIKEAVLRELLRGGQVYYLHNEVSTIENTAEELSQWLPEARIGIAHGQMPERQLERVMQDFYHKRYNLLLCSTIIETGIDIPNANTMIIERADKFGLAQLHQLRGRVGRSHHQAYAYLLTPQDKKPTADAQKRLDAIAAHEDLGAGFLLASQDMEIRGAGELLGDEQSGQIEGLGFSLYMELLEEAVQAIREGRTPQAHEPLRSGTEINLYFPALIPEDYLPDVNLRLQLYKRIASATTSSELKDLQVEMIDRFGLLPEAAKHLFQQAALKQKAKALNLPRIDAGKEKGVIYFGDQPKINTSHLIQLIQTQARHYQLDGQQALKFNLIMEPAQACFKQLEQLLDQLS